jgi:hypothetical protein
MMELRNLYRTVMIDDTDSRAKFSRVASRKPAIAGGLGHSPPPPDPPQ